MTTQSSPTMIATIRRAAHNALQARLILLWVLGLAVPTLLFALPVHHLLAENLDYSLGAQTMAERIDLDTITSLVHIEDFRSGPRVAASLASGVVMLLLYCWLNGLVVVAARATGVSGFRALFDGANGEYFRMLRLTIWGFIPLGIAAGIVGAISKAIDHYSDSAILSADVDHLQWISYVVMAVLYILALCSIEAARAHLAADARRRSVILAWFAGVKSMWRRPVKVLGSYCLLSIAGLVVAAVLLLARINIGQANAIGLLAAFVLAELIVICLAWMRCARVFALTDLLRQHS